MLKNADYFGGITKYIGSNVREYVYTHLSTYKYTLIRRFYGNSCRKQSEARN